MASSGKKVIQEGAFNVYAQELGETPKEELSHGNWTRPQSLQVLRKIASEAIEKEMNHRDYVRDLELLWDSFDAQDTSYIVSLSVRPFKVICMSEEQLKRMSSTDACLYLDSTGSLIHAIKDQKRPYLYSLVLQEPVIFSIADMISTDHTVPTITHFLLQLRHHYFKVTNK